MQNKQDMNSKELIFAEQESTLNGHEEVDDSNPAIPEMLFAMNVENQDILLENVIENVIDLHHEEDTEVEATVHHLEDIEVDLLADPHQEEDTENDHTPDPHPLEAERQAQTADETETAAEAEASPPEEEAEASPPDAAEAEASPQEVEAEASPLNDVAEASPQDDAAEAETETTAEALVAVGIEADLLLLHQLLKTPRQSVASLRMMMLPVVTP